jgi:ankyrin repeat protein
LPVSLAGATPFWLAAKFVEGQIMGVLAASGADPLVVMKDGTTALMAATGVGSPEGVDRRGLSVTDGGGRRAEESRVLETVKLAIDLGADVNATNRVGDTALHGAVSEGYNTVVQLLADKGANLDARNKSGLTPLAMTADSRAGIIDSSRSLKSTAALLRKLGAREMMANEKAPDVYVRTMTGAGAASQSLRANVQAKDYDAIAKDAASLKTVFATAEAFWTARKIEDAIAAAKGGGNAAADLETAAMAKNDERITTMARAVNGACATCHTAHRERMPDGSFEIR